MQFICDNVAKLGLKESILDLDVTLARGLNYYTGAIFEVLLQNQLQWAPLVVAEDIDDLTGIFGLKDIVVLGFLWTRLNLFGC